VGNRVASNNRVPNPEIGNEAKQDHRNRHLDHWNRHLDHWIRHLDHWNRHLDHWIRHLDHWIRHLDHWNRHLEHWNRDLDHWNRHLDHWNRHLDHWNRHLDHWNRHLDRRCRCQLGARGSVRAAFLDWPPMVVADIPKASSDGASRSQCCVSRLGGRLGMLLPHCPHQLPKRIDYCFPLGGCNFVEGGNKV